MISMISKFLHYLYMHSPDVHAGFLFLLILQITLKCTRATDGKCGQYKAWNPTYMECRRCNYCCTKKSGGTVYNLTVERECAGLKKDSFLYSCFEEDEEDVCPLHMFPIHSNALVTDSSFWNIVAPIMIVSILLVIPAVIVAVVYFRKKRQKKKNIRKSTMVLELTSMLAKYDAEHLVMDETSRKNMSEDPSGEAAREQTCEEEANASSSLLPGDAQDKTMSAPVQDSQKPGSPGTASSHMDQNNPETLHYDAKNQMNKLEPMDANFSSQAKPGASE